MSCYLKFWVIFVLLFYNISAFSSQCRSIFEFKKQPIIALADEINRHSDLEYSPNKPLMMTPKMELTTVLNRLEFYNQRFDQYIGEARAPLWMSSVRFEYESFFKDKTEEIKKITQDTLKQKNISLNQYTSILMRLTFLAQSLENIIFIIENPNNRKALFYVTRTYSDFEVAAVKDLKYEMREYEHLVAVKSNELISNQKSVYENTAFKLRALLTTQTPSIQTMNQLLSMGFSVLTIAKKVTQADGLEFSVINFLRHDQEHLNTNAYYLMSMQPKFIADISARLHFNRLQRNQYLKKTTKFYQKLNVIKTDLPSLEAYLIDVVYFYTAHELGLPPHTGYLKSFFRVRSNKKIASAIYEALTQKQWGYDPVIENSTHLKKDIFSAINNFKKAF